MQRLYRFFGGLRLGALPAQAAVTDNAIIPMPPPAELRLPLSNAQCACVQTGDTVAAWQLLARATHPAALPVHAPCAGRIRAVEAGCIVLTTDAGAVTPAARAARSDWRELDQTALAQALRDAGIAGLGGAAFASHRKLARPVQTLIINGVECEPQIHCDDALMRHEAGAVIEACGWLARRLGVDRALLACKQDAQAVLAALRAALASGPDAVDIVPVPALYPQGAARQLIRTLTGQEIAAGRHSIDAGIAVFNVATVVAMLRAVREGEPQVSRLVSVAGAVARPGTYRVAFGTPVSALIDFAGGATLTDTRVLIGGPMMGVVLEDPDAPVSAATNAVLVQGRSRAAAPEPQACIRCGDCVPACPSRLLPQQLYWHAQAGEFAKAAAIGLDDCIECGCCDAVCPSQLPLTQWYRHARQAWHQLLEADTAALAARARYEAREQRLVAERDAQEQARRRRKELLNQDPPHAASSAASSAAAGETAALDPVAAALARARARRQTSTPPPEGGQ